MDCSNPQPLGLNLGTLISSSADLPILPRPATGPVSICSTTVGFCQTTRQARPAGSAAPP